MSCFYEFELVALIYKNRAKTANAKKFQAESQVEFA
jgi:hypothetical protein